MSTPSSDRPSAPPPPVTGESRPKSSFVWELIAALPIWIYGIVLLVMASLQGFEKAEKVAGDLQAKVRAGAGEAVAIVKITTADYREHFGSRSPLEVGTLRRLIENIAGGRPAVIGVDIDTSDASFAALRDLECDCQIVWARDARSAPDGTLEPGNVLGGRELADLAASGLVILFEDPGDKVTRRYARKLRTSEGDIESFPSRVARTHSLDVAGRKADTTSMSILYSASARFEVPASVVLAEGFEWRDRIRGRVVLLGGSYDRDKHHTPLGEIDGVEVLANAIETEFRGGGTTRPHWSGIVLLGALQAIAVIALFHALRWWMALIAAIALTALEVVLLIALGEFTYWPYLVAVLLGIVLHEFKGHVRVDSHFVTERAAHALFERIRSIKRE